MRWGRCVQCDAKLLSEGCVDKMMLRYIWSVAAYVVFYSSGLANCAVEHVHLSGSWGSAKFTVEVVDTDTERAQGLMHRDSLAKFASMLFVYDTPQQVAFWMKNTLIPLDILYFTAEGVLLDIRENAVPGDLTPFRSSGPVQYVLEVNAGLAKTLKFGSDTILGHARVAHRKKTQACQ